MRILSTLRGLLRQTPVTNGRLEGDMDANGQRIVNVGEPTLDDDAATKKYVDDHGGGGGTSDYNRLNNKPTLNDKTLQGAVVLTGADIETEPNSGRLVTEVLSGVENSLNEKADRYELRITMQLVGTDTYTIQLDGVELTFSQIKTYAQTRNAVIQRGQGTYRVTYIGASEMMWDVTGTVAGNVQTGQIHIFDLDGMTVVQRVDPKVLAEKSEVEAAQSTASEAQSTAEAATSTADVAYDFSNYPISEVMDGELLDRTVNTSTGGAFAFPAPGAGARDFVVVVAASATAPSVSFPSSGVTYFSDDDAVWTAEANKVNIWYFTEIAENKFMVAHKALAATTQA